MSMIAEARAHDRAEPVYLLEIGLLGADAPVLYLAERDLVAGGNCYESYLSEVQGLEWRLGSFAPVGPHAGPGFRLLNEPWREFSRLIEVGEEFPFEGASISLRETYLVRGGAPVPPEILFVGVLESTIAIDLMDLYISARGLWPGRHAG